MKRIALILGVALLVTLFATATWASAGVSTNQVPGTQVATGSAFLDPTADSTASGTALLEFNSETGNTTVTLLVRGLSPGSSHAAHIHLDSCTGTIAFPLNDVVANTNGVGLSRTVIKSPINVTNWWVNVHRDPELPSPGITCGKVEAVSAESGPSPSPEPSPGPPPEPGPPPGPTPSPGPY